MFAQSLNWQLGVSMQKLRSSYKSVLLGMMCWSGLVKLRNSRFLENFGHSDASNKSRDLMLYK